MLVTDTKARPWIAMTVIVLIAGVLGYWPYSAGGRVSGGSWAGLGYGVVSGVMMLLAMLLAPRKRYRTLRVGRAYLWMQIHVWFGLLSLPFALFHGGFHFGMTWGLTWVIMWLFIIVWVSGIVGLVFQQIIPRVILERVERENVYEQHEHVLLVLRRETNDCVESAERSVTIAPIDVEVVPAGGVATATLAPSSANTAVLRLKNFAIDYVLPFLDLQPPATSPLRQARRATGLFDQLRASMPIALHEAANDLEQLTTEWRQVLLHRRLHRWLHAWLLIHVPLSYALIVLVALHVVYALRYI